MANEFPGKVTSLRGVVVKRKNCWKDPMIKGC
jgi:hypothetical protein